MGVYYTSNSRMRAISKTSKQIYSSVEKQSLYNEVYRKAKEKHPNASKNVLINIGNYDLKGMNVLSPSSIHNTVLNKTSRKVEDVPFSSLKNLNSQKDSRNITRAAKREDELQNKTFEHKKRSYLTDPNYSPEKEVDRILLKKKNTLLSVTDQKEEEITKTISKNKKQQGFEFASQLSASSLKTLEDLNKRNSKSINKRNMMNMNYYPYTQKSDVLRNQNYSVNMRNYLCTDLTQNQNSMNDLFNNQFNIKDTSFMKEVSSKKYKKLIICGKEDEKPNFIYVDEQYKEVDIEEDKDKNIDSKSQNIIKSPYKRVFLKNSHTFSSDKKLLLPMLKIKRLDDTTDDKYERLVEKIKAREQLNRSVNTKDEHDSMYNYFNHHLGDKISQTLKRDLRTTNPSVTAKDIYSGSALKF